MRNKRKKGENDLAVQRRRARKLVIGAFVTGGVFQLTSWQAQAHGNRSSHLDLLDVKTSANMRGPEDYVLMREQIFAPHSVQTSVLSDVVSRLDQLEADGATDSEEYRALSERRKQIESELKMGPLSSQVIEFLRDGETEAAIATLEGDGSTDNVLSNYQWVLLDIANQRIGLEYDMKDASDFFAVAKPAIDYIDRVAQTGLSDSPYDVLTKVRMAEILHNIGTYIAENKDAAPAEYREASLAAAERALRLRQEIGSPVHVMRAKTALGLHYYRAGDMDTARRYLTSSIAQAGELADPAGAAWAKLYLSKVAQADDPEESRALLAEVRSIAGDLEASGHADSNLLLEAIDLEE